LVDKFVYRAPTVDSEYNEFELDYLYFGSIKNSEITPNKNEISDHMWVDQKELKKQF